MTLAHRAETRIVGVVRAESWEVDIETLVRCLHTITGERQDNIHIYSLLYTIHTYVCILFVCVVYVCVQVCSSLLSCPVARD